MAEVEHRIWAAQIQVLFPIVELERVDLIRKYEFEIQAVLNNNALTYYGEPINNAIDVELGTLCYLMGRRNDEGLFSLHIPDKSDRDRIKFLHDCRNCLAHVSCCSPNQIRELLNK